MNRIQLLQSALEHHRAGRLHDAEMLYRQVIEQEPGNADALHFLGVLAHQVGRNEVAVTLIERAIGFRPDVPSFYNNLGIAYRQLSQLEKSLSVLARGLALSPNDPSLLNNHALILTLLGRFAEAETQFRRALRLKPDYAEACNNLGNVLVELGKTDEAAALYRRAHDLNRTYFDPLTNLAALYAKLGRETDCREVIEDVIARDPGNPSHPVRLAGLYLTRGDHAAVEYWARRALAADPEHPMAWHLLANSHHGRGDISEAINAYRKALSLNPRSVEIMNDLALALEEDLQLDAAMQLYDQALAIKPDYAESRMGRSLILLLRGDFANGLLEYEWRRKLKQWPETARSKPLWNGEPMRGKRLLVALEQGLGDSVMLARFLPLLRDAGAKVFVETLPATRALLATIDGIEPVDPDSGSEFDLWTPLMSIPAALAITEQTIPRNVPYLKVDEARVDRYRPKLEVGADIMKVGLVWAGTARHRKDHSRSIDPTLLAPLFGVKDVQFVSLQKFDPNSPLTRAPESNELVDFTNELTDLADTAAVMSMLDLVITVDSAPAHVAGAIGKRVWTLLPRSCDWRWMLNRQDTPWYPTMRLFRCTQHRNWTPVLERVANELEIEVASRRAKSDNKLGNRWSQS